MGKASKKRAKSKSKVAGKNIGTYNSWEIRILRNYNYIKANNKELLKKINTMGYNISLSNITSVHPAEYTFESDDLFNELYRQKEFSPLVRTYLANRMLLSKQK